MSSANRQEIRDLIAEHRKWLPERDAPFAKGSADRILSYDAAKDEARWEDRISIHRSDPIP